MLAEAVRALSSAPDNHGGSRGVAPTRLRGLIPAHGPLRPQLVCLAASPALWLHTVWPPSADAPLAGKPALTPGRGKVPAASLLAFPWFSSSFHTVRVTDPSGPARSVSSPGNGLCLFLSSGASGAPRVGLGPRCALGTREAPAQCPDSYKRPQDSTALETPGPKDAWKRSP